MNADHTQYQGTSTDGTDLLLTHWHDGRHPEFQIAMRRDGISFEAPVTMVAWANTVADGPREMLPRETPTPPSVHLGSGWES